MFPGRPDGGTSFEDLMNTYGNEPASAIGGSSSSSSSNGSGSGFSFQMPGSLQSGLQGLGSSVSSGLASVGAPSYLQQGFSGATGSTNRDNDGQAGDIEQGPSALGGIAEDANSSLMSLSRTDRFKGFVLMLVLSSFFFLLSLLFVGTAPLFPAKFAFPFSMGSVCFMAAFALMKGPAAWCKSAFGTSGQLPFTLAYFGSILGTLYACLVMRSYFFTIIMASIQVVALGYYAFGNMPGGKYGLRMMGALIKQFMKNVCWPCAKGLGKLFTSLVSS